MDLQTLIDRHGMAVQPVRTDHPHDPPFAYTVGRHLRGQPELIVFGGHPERAGSLLNELDRDHGATTVRAGAELPTAEFRGNRVRLRPARPEWVARYGLAAFAHARADPADVPFLQVVVSDRDGRLPGERGRPACCACCPDLSHPDRPFVLPLDSTDLYDIVHVLDGRPASTVGVCVPVRVDGADVGRVERLVAEDLGNDRVRLLHPPLVADWTTAPASASTRPWAGCSACRA